MGDIFISALKDACAIHNFDLKELMDPHKQQNVMNTE